MTPRGRALTTGQAATALGVSIGTARRWAKAGLIPCLILPSGRLRFDADEIEAVLQRRPAA